MLSDIREKATGPLALVILVVIALSFVFVGVAGNYNFLTGAWVAKVDGEEIGVGYFEARYQNVVQGNPQLATAEGEARDRIRRELLDSLIYEQLVQNFLNDNGYRIGDEQLVQSIRRIPEFQDETGQFNRDNYDALIAGSMRTDAQFEEQHRATMRQQQLQLAIGASGFVTPSEYRRYINLIGEERLVTLATFSPESVTEEIVIDEEALAAYYENNPTLFQRPESADIEYVLIDRAEVAQSIEIDEARLQQYYEENQFRYLQDEQREARHILITVGDDEAAAEAEINDLYARVQAGESFEDLAREFSDDGGTASSGGFLGASTRAQLPGELGSAIFEMNEGDVAGPIRTSFGFHIIRLDRVLEQGSQPLDQVRAELLNELREQEAISQYQALENELGNALFDSPDINDAAAAAGLELRTATGITRAGGEPFGNNQPAIDAIFEEAVLTGGQTSDLIELDASRSAVFRVTRYNEQTRQPLVEVTDQIIGILTAEEAERILKERADALFLQVEAGAEFRGTAEAAGATVSEPILLSRRDQEQDPAVRYSVFAAPKPEGAPVRQVVRNSAGGYTVYSLDAVRPGDPRSIPLAERDEGKLFRAQDSGFRDFGAFLLTLRDNANVVVNEDALAASDFTQPPL